MDAHTNSDAGYYEEKDAIGEILMQIELDAVAEDAAADFDALHGYLTDREVA